MSSRSARIGEMFGWIPSSFGLVTRNFGSMAGASLITLLVGLLMVLPLVLVIFASLKGLGSPGVPVAPPDMTPIVIGYCAMLVVGLALMPPLVGGWFRLCEAADRREAVSALQVLGPYRDGATWARLVVFALLAMLTYVVFFGAIVLLFRGAFTELMAMQAAQMAGMQPDPNPAVLGKILLMYAVMIPVGSLLQTVYMVGMAEVALRPTSALVALKDAFATVGRNLAKLLVFGFCLLVAFMVLAFVLGLLVALVFVALSFLSPVISMVLVGLLYIAALCFIYPLMFAGGFYAWRSLLE